jgi:hypothetical protein
MDNIFFAVDEDPNWVFYETQGVNSTLADGWTLTNNTVYKCTHQLATMMAPTPAVGAIVYQPDGSAHVTLTPRDPYTDIKSIFWTVDGSWPMLGSNSTASVSTKFIPPNLLANATLVVSRTTALNVRYAFEGMLDSFTMTLLVPVG